LLLGAIFSRPIYAVKVKDTTLQVIYKAARQYNVDAQDLVYIAYTESKFNHQAKRVNTNGTVDWGMFQINSVHWTTTCSGINIKTLRGNALCAAKIIASLEARHKLTDPQWLGRYHSATPSRKRAYQRKLDEAEQVLRERLKQVTEELEQCKSRANEPIEVDPPVFARN